LKKEGPLKSNIIFFLIFLSSSVSAYCGQVEKIELTDNSVINGEITSMSGGVYTVNTAFGEIKIDQGKVAKIESGIPAQENSSASYQLEGYKQQLMSNPQNAAIVTGLAAAPEIQELVKDPQIVAAAKAFDIQALMKNEKFMNVVHSPRVQETYKKLQQ
jgi:hypothetical protein